jgi:hypothetical protein
MYINYNLIKEDGLTGTWLMQQCPVLYGAECTYRHLQISISIMNLREDIPYMTNWKHKFLLAYVRRIRFPCHCDYNSLFQFYKREMISKLRLFPFIVRSDTFIIMQFDCLPQCLHKNRESQTVYVSFYFPPICELPGKYFMDNKTVMQMVLPHILDFLRKVTSCKKPVFLVGTTDEDCLTSFRLLDPYPEIIKPDYQKPYWMVTCKLAT